MGIDEELISIGRLDDQWMVFAGVRALLDSKEIDSTKVMICVDNEEIGSLTSQGANSSNKKIIRKNSNISRKRNRRVL